MPIRTYYDPLHQSISLNSSIPEEKMVMELIDSSPFQRLRRIKQLGPAYLTFHGAESSRFTHSLGVFHIARRAINHLSKIDSSLIKYIIDDSPLKQNRFTPGMHIKILPRKNNLSNIDIVIVFAYEYFKDIKKIFKNKNVIFFKPIPFNKLL